MIDLIVSLSQYTITCDSFQFSKALIQNCEFVTDVLVS